ncbi:uncharacterized protein E0L32_011371 [Thyridium curvatum]|uniref:Phosphoribosyltransferase domain-containing protein n=1 Tax=Thyridium curvatum TaxID=1093900 RepID=A0A507BQ53_9PEZI|nr:uncharacterized protein E0L32_011371 [Thyridium curvatum]TPX18978.1 hypothetical protein E0L32_011371 [Thyridium curvatum]
MAPKPTVIGIYGLPGSGKSFQMGKLKQNLERHAFDYYEGSDKIASLVDGGLSGFQRLGEQEQHYWRQQAINDIAHDCASKTRSAIVTGHFMFWEEGEDSGHPVYTMADMNSFTHIIYLDVPTHTLAKRRLNDPLKNRSVTSIDHLQKWQAAEISYMRHLCRHHRILFLALPDALQLPTRVSELVCRFSQYTAESNWSLVKAHLDDTTDNKSFQTALVIDGDKTLAPFDTGSLFWKAYAEARSKVVGPCPLKELFSGPLGYSDTAFFQAMLLYEEAAGDDAFFEGLCDTVASSVQMYDDFVSLLRSVESKEHILSIVVTCGLRRVWEKILRKQGLSSTICVLGGGRAKDKFIITPAAKASLVTHLRQEMKVHVWAFGDSPLDLPMLEAADKAVVVVGDDSIRSRSMENALVIAMEQRGFQAQQVLLPSHVTPRLDFGRLPRMYLSHDMFSPPGQARETDQKDGCNVFAINILHATYKDATKILMTPTRDASVYGATLRAAHQRIGQYLATEFLPALLGTEEYAIPHVQGHDTSGYRIRNESRTSLIALMRGGEPLALGVSDMLARAMFVHATSPADVKHDHVQGQATVVLVDSVINTGKTLIQFIERVRLLQVNVRIVVIAAVVQMEAIANGSNLATVMKINDVALITLRLSKNKFTGTKTTDTGNRLFNTTHLV